MDPQVSEEQLSAYLDDELSVEERALVDRALAGDDRLRRRLEELERVGSLVQQLPIEPSQRDFRRRTLAALKAGDGAADVGGNGSFDREGTFDSEVASRSSWNAYVPLGVGLLATAALLLVILNVVKPPARRSAEIALSKKADSKKADEAGAEVADLDVEQQPSEQQMSDDSVEQPEAAMQRAMPRQQMAERNARPQTAQESLARESLNRMRRRPMPTPGGGRPSNDRPMMMTAKPLEGAKLQAAAVDPVERIVALGRRFGRVDVLIEPAVERKAKDSDTKDSDTKDKAAARQQDADRRGGAAEPPGGGGLGGAGRGAGGFGAGAGRAVLSESFRYQYGVASSEKPASASERDVRGGKRGRMDDGGVKPGLLKLRDGRGVLVLRGTEQDVRRQLSAALPQLAGSGPVRFSLVAATAAETLGGDRKLDKGRGREEAKEKGSVLGVPLDQGARKEPTAKKAVPAESSSIRLRVIIVGDERPSRNGK